MKKTVLLSIIALCASMIHAADTKEDLKRQFADQQRKESKAIVNQFTDEQKQEAFVCMIMGVDGMYALGEPNVDQSVLKQLTHSEGNLAQTLRPLNFDTYQIITADGLGDEDRVATYGSFAFLNMYHSTRACIQHETSDVEKLNAVTLYALVELQDAASSHDFNQVCKMHIKRLLTMRRIHNEHNVQPLNKEQFNELFDKNAQWNPWGQKENCTAIQRLTEALNEQKEDIEHEKSLLPVYKQAYNETLEEYMKIHSS